MKTRPQTGQKLQNLRGIACDPLNRYLYFRLSRHRIVLPPLRDRPGDIELLAGYFLKKYRPQFVRIVEKIDPEAMKILTQYHFPGNVRELEGILEHAVMLEPGPVLLPSALPDHLKEEAESSEYNLERVRYKTIMKVLDLYKGNQSRAADRLGISRSTLKRFLKECRGTSTSPSSGPASETDPK